MAQALWRLAKATRGGAVPVVPLLHKPLYALHLAITGLFAQPDARALLDASVPVAARGCLPPISISTAACRWCWAGCACRFGADCRVSAQSTFSGRSSSEDPVLTVGRNVDIGWQTTIAVGRRVTIGDNVRIAGRAFLAGYPGHPLDAATRAAGLPDTDDQIGDIVLEDDVWLATGVTVSAGVTIGRGTIVAAGSVVTKDLPAFVLAAGAPAKVVRSLVRAE